MNGATTSSPDPEVVTAVKFLNWFTVRGYPESNLKKYLTDKRNLNNSQINEAFRIYQNQTKQNDKPVSPQNKQNDKPVSPSGSTEFDSHVSFLILEKQQEGKELVKQFLKDDGEYCAILQCLHEEYYKDLSAMADEGKFQMTREELEQIFRHIPTLYEFHKVFNTDMNRGCNVGWMFVGLFIFFHGYVDYMKDCLFAIRKMREYIHDKKLQECMTQIRRRSKRRADNMVDLLLVPLDRIQDYKNFLDQLYEWSDKSQVADYEFLGKASRRIGRVASYIAQYKHGISNKNEMNKVQLFVGTQCSVLHPKRLVVRRGMMSCRTFDLPERKLSYMFFLFNDILLWTTKNSKTPNIVELWNAKVKPSEAREKLNLKFKIVSGVGQNNKILFLECKSKRQRDGWYKAIETGIWNAVRGNVESWSRVEGVTSADEEKSAVTSNVSLENKTEEDNLLWKKDALRSSNHKMFAKNETPIKIKIGQLNEYPKLENYGSARSFGSTRSFENQEFEDFKPLTRTLSCTTFQDFGFCDENKQYEKAENSASVLSNRKPRVKPRVKILLPDEKKDDGSEGIRRNAFGCTTSFRKNMFISNPNSRRASVTNAGSGLSTPRTVFFDQRRRLNNVIGKTDEMKINSDRTILGRNFERSPQNLKELSPHYGDSNFLMQPKDREDDESSKSDSSSIRCIDEELNNTKVRYVSSGKQKRISLRLNDINEAYTK